MVRVRFGTWRSTSLRQQPERPDMDLDSIANAAHLLQYECHELAADSGWWRDLSTGLDMTCHYEVDVLNGHERPKRNIGEMLCLIHSEISEAMEGARKGLMDDHLPHRCMLEVELADAVIRIFDMAGGLHLDLAGAIADKMLYNARRADHRPENRAAAGGKGF